MLSRNQTGQILRLLLFIAPTADLIDAQVRMRAIGQAQRCARPADFLDRNYMFEIAQPQPTILFGYGEAMQAELTQPPFDMPVAESELVTGYMTEYSGIRFLLFFIGEFATAGIFAMIASALFLGGWWVPGIDPDSNLFNIVGPAVMFAKVIGVTFLVFWFRITYPRFREDQLQKLAWKVLIPIALLNIVVTGILKVAF